MIPSFAANKLYTFQIILPASGLSSTSHRIALCSDIETFSSWLRNPHVLPLLADIEIPCWTSGLALPMGVFLDSLFRVLLLLFLMRPFFLVMIMYMIRVMVSIASCRCWPRVIHTFWFLLFIWACSFPKKKEIVEGISENETVHTLNSGACISLLRVVCLPL